MADTKISALSAATLAAVANELAINEAGTSKKISITQLKTLLQTLGMPRVTHLGAQHSISSSTATIVSGLTQTLEANGSYIFDYRLIERSATITVAPLYGLNFTGTTTKSRWWFQYADLSATLLAAIGTVAHDTSTATLGFQMAKAEDDYATTTANMGPSATTNAVQTINTDLMVQITGLIVVGAAGGDLQLYHGSETATATSVEVGSSLVVIRTA